MTNLKSPVYNSKYNCLVHQYTAQELKQYIENVSKQKGFLVTTINLEITPEIAQILLQKNDTNRPIKETHIKFLKRQIQEDKWQFNGATIVLSRSGILLDGQHRLTSVIRSGELKHPIVSSVTFGIDENVFSSIDTGNVRQASDILSIAKYDYSQMLSAAIKIIIRYNLYNVAANHWGRDEKRNNEEVLEFAKTQTKEYWSELCATANKYVQREGNALGFSASEIIAFLYILEKSKNPDYAKHKNFFLERVFMGYYKNKNENFIDYFIKKMKNSKSKEISLTQFLRMGYLFKTFQMYIKGSQAKTMSFDPSKEEFPVL